MRFYRQSILIFGAVLPGVLLLAALFGIIALKSSMTASFQSKKQDYEAFNRDQKVVKEIEKQISRQRPHLNRWQDALNEQAASSVTGHLRAIAERVPDKEYQLTAFDPSGTGGLGSVSAQKSSQMRIAFRGTYRTMQQVFLELESRMPQLQLQELRIDPSANNPSSLNFQVSYTAWEN